MIALIFIGDLLYCPYLKKYQTILDQRNIRYDLIYWNRSGLDYEDAKHNYISFNKKSKLNKSKFSKAGDFMCYRKWLKKLLKRKKYQKLILLSSLSGMLLLRTLLKEYKGNYIFDIRDYSYEKNPLYYRLEKKIIDHSNFTMISSRGFQSFLPNTSSYVVTHNMSLEDLACRKEFRKRKKERLNFVWMGAVRYLEHQARIMEKLDRDGRFCLIYHGSGSELEDFRKYAQEKNLTNVIFTGRYSNADKSRLLEEADILNNSYAINQETKYAVSNKFYDGLVFHIPQLVEAGGYKAAMLREYPVGLELDIEDDEFADKLYQYYYNLQEDEFNRFCDELAGRFVKEEEECIRRIEEFVAG